MRETLITPEVLQSQAEIRPRVSAISLLNLALQKIEEERSGETLDAQTIEERDNLWTTTIGDIESPNLRILLQYVYEGIFYFWNDPKIIQEYYGELKEDFNPFFQTYIRGFCHDLIGKANPKSGITIYRVGDGFRGSGEYTDKVLGFLDGMEPSAFNDHESLSGKIQSDLLHTFELEIPEVIAAYRQI